MYTLWSSADMGFSTNGFWNTTPFTSIWSSCSINSSSVINSHQNNSSNNHLNSNNKNINSNIITTITATITKTAICIISIQVIMLWMSQKDPFLLFIFSEGNNCSITMGQCPGLSEKNQWYVYTSTCISISCQAMFEYAQSARECF